VFPEIVTVYHSHLILGSTVTRVRSPFSTVSNGDNRHVALESQTNVRAQRCYAYLKLQSSRRVCSKMLDRRGLSRVLGPCLTIIRIDSMSGPGLEDLEKCDNVA